MKQKQCIKILLVHTESYQQGIIVLMSFMQKLLFHRQRITLHCILLIPYQETAVSVLHPLLLMCFTI